MKVERIVIKGCCNRKQVVFKIDRPITEPVLAHLKSNGFTEAPNFAKAGLLYADNTDLYVSGPFGSDRLTAKCKQEGADCDRFLNDFEALLLKMG